QAALEVLLGSSNGIQNVADTRGPDRADDADRRAHLVHRMRIQWQRVDRRLHLRGKRAVCTLGLTEVRQFGCRRQLTMPEQIGDRLEGLSRRKLLHRIPAVQQTVRLGVDLADRRLICDDAGKTLLDVAHSHSFVMVKLKTPESKWLYDS